MSEKLWEFIDNFGSFQSKIADELKVLYFPLANETLMSAVSPDLRGDSKTGGNSFLLTPVSRIDLTTSRTSRNFWIYISKDKVWSAAGVSKDLKQIKNDQFGLEAGLLYHKVIRKNKNIGLKAEILSFVPATGEPIEIMQVKITNISGREINFIPTAAIPVYARSADNLRDHRHVTSLLNRIRLNKFGVMVKPTLVFDEFRHQPNRNIYFVLGWDEKFSPPQYIYPTQEMFCAEQGDLEAPFSVIENTLPKKENIQGKEAMAALRFRKINLLPAQSHSYIILMGIVQGQAGIKKIINNFKHKKGIEDSLKQTKDFWIAKSNQICLSTGSFDFDNWFRWVSIQPKLREIFGCSFLPDFDYGKGGRGWRDLWQDALSLILTNPQQARRLLINNFSGVRIDGSNATIIGRQQGEFISDRNNISRVWMDHAVWPLLTLDLYLNETGDFNILFAEAAYFRDHQIFRSRQFDRGWSPAYGYKLKTSAGKIYKGTILEHLLIENLSQFFNVGSHNHIRLEGADWNDGLDMAKEHGESVAFSAMYAHNLHLLAELLLKSGRRTIIIAEEIKILFAKINYSSVNEKRKILERYFTKVKNGVCGRKISLDVDSVARSLKIKSAWISQYIRRQEWLKEVGFFNGYYDNQKKRVEGKKNGVMRMMLQSQVFAIMSGVAGEEQIRQILKSVQKYLFDKRLKGYHLNTDFRAPQHHFGRAFSFVYGDKENGAYFSHMVVMFAYALYKRGFVKEGWQALSSIYRMATDTQKSKIYPCLPEYFNLEGRGMYAYLTGSASWFVLTILTQVFGIRAKEGDLLIEPKLCQEQFNYSSSIAINKTFAERKLEIRFSNPKRLSWGKYKIIKASLNSADLPLKEPHCFIIKRKTILGLPADRINRLNIVLG